MLARTAKSDESLRKLRLRRVTPAVASAHSAKMQFKSPQRFAAE